MTTLHSLAIAGIAAFLVVPWTAAAGSAQCDDDHHATHHGNTQHAHAHHAGDAHAIGLHAVGLRNLDYPGPADGEHPDPRPGVSAADVASLSFLRFRAARTYRMAREIPHVLDGIRCPCNCDENWGHYSLLTCFGEDRLATYCGACRIAAELAWELHRDGKDLDQIRDAIDARLARPG